MRQCLLAAVAVLVFLMPASSRADDLTPAEEELALALAKVIVNEAGWESRPDAYLIWQTVRGSGQTAEARLAWLREHSSCVLGTEPLTGRRARGFGNCHWTRNLTDSDAEPAGWPAGLPWDRHVPLWRRIRAFSRHLVRVRAPQVCSERPHTWGGRMDEERALERGMRPLGCTGTVNEGYRYD